MAETAALCRFAAAPHRDVRIGLVEAGSVRDLTTAGVRRLDDLLERADVMEQLARARQAALVEWPLDQVRLLTPVESQEVWAAGVTYLRSKQARME
jgi:2-dehydro-3-deoxy-D-arabinonate dehydratase